MKSSSINRGVKLSLFILVLGLVATYQDCSPAAFYVKASPVPGITGNGPAAVLQVLKPTLAVRGINCMFCHAQIQSSVLTDFGLGDPQFFVGQSGITPSKAMTLPWYGNYYGTWQLADQISGNVYVPQTSISDSTFLNSINQTNSVSLAQIMNLDLGANYYGDAPYSGAGPMVASGQVQELSQLYIGAPTASQILALANPPLSPGPKWQAIGTGSSILNLVVQSGTGGSYITNPVVAGAVGSTIKCFGDVVIQGTLFLNNVTVDTDDNGCRLMVTGSVFIQGPISYASTSGTQNLQISSASAILLGFDTSSIAFRLSQWYPDSQPMFRASKNGGPTNTQINAAVVAEADVIGNPLEDPGYILEGSYSHPPTNNPPPSACPPGNMVTYTGHNGGGSSSTDTECSISYSRLLLNAPNIQSRYVGVYSGVAIAEIALFAPGALQFKYDPVFSSVPILPLIGSLALNAAQ